MVVASDSVTMDFESDRTDPSVRRGDLEGLLTAAVGLWTGVGRGGINLQFLNDPRVHGLGTPEHARAAARAPVFTATTNALGSALASGILRAVAQRTIQLGPQRPVLVLCAIDRPPSGEPRSALGDAIANARAEVASVATPGAFTIGFVQLGHDPETERFLLGLRTVPGAPSVALHSDRELELGGLSVRDYLLKTFLGAVDPRYR